MPAGSNLTLASDLTFDQVASINLLAPQLPGVETETAYSRRYDHGEQTGHITGYLGRVERHGIDDDPLLRLASSKVGKSGIEGGMELPLRGKGGARKVEVDARGRIVRNLDEIEPVNGSDVVLSIDLALQSRVMARLTAAPQAGQWLAWSRALWLGAAACTMVALFASVWAPSAADDPASSFSEGVEQIIMASWDDFDNAW